MEFCEISEHSHFIPLSTVELPSSSISQHFHNFSLTTETLTRFTSNRLSRHIPFLSARYSTQTHDNHIPPTPLASN